MMKFLQCYTQRVKVMSFLSPKIGQNLHAKMESFCRASHIRMYNGDTVYQRNFYGPYMPHKID